MAPQIKRFFHDTPRPISLAKLQAEISVGKIGPGYWLLDEKETDSAWMKMNDLTMFHERSPKNYRYGRILGVKIYREQEANRKKRYIEQQTKHYRDLLTRTHALGVACLKTQPSFFPPSEYVFLFRPSGILCDKITMPYSEVPGIMFKWERFEQFVEQNVRHLDPRVGCLDGTRYTLELCTQVRWLDFEWGQGEFKHYPVVRDIVGACEEVVRLQKSRA